MLLSTPTELPTLGLRVSEKYSSLKSHRLLMGFNTDSCSWLLEVVALKKNAQQGKTGPKRGVVDIAANSASLLGRSGCSGCTCMHGIMTSGQVASLMVLQCWPNGSLFAVIVVITTTATTDS
jgi:hypothetical protein